MASTVYTFEAHPVETRTGIYCPRCLLPTAVSVTVAIAASDSLQVLARATGEHCPSCDRTEVTR